MVQSEKVERPSAKELANAAPLVEVVKAAAFTQAMVTIDHHFDNLKLSRKEGWKTPQEHPDVDPPHEALQLLEQYRELESLLRAAKKAKRIDSETADKVFQRMTATCTACHAKYRD